MIEMKKVLIIGATGMLGHMVYYYLKDIGSYELYNSVYRTKLTEDSIFCNVKDQTALNKLFETVKPHVVINCVGALVRESKENPSRAIYLNALFPHILKDLANAHQAKLIHVSTDCVFSGKRGNYTEDDFRDADDIYGRSKALGEIFDAPHCTLRTSIIGPELKTNGTGLFHWFFESPKNIEGYKYVVWSGVTTLHLSKIIHEAIERDFQGLLNITNGKQISKHDLLYIINDVFQLEKNIFPNEDIISNKSLVSNRGVNYSTIGYQEMIYELQIWINKYSHLYSHYFFHN